MRSTHRLRALAAAFAALALLFTGGLGAAASPKADSMSTADGPEIIPDVDEPMPPSNHPGVVPLVDEVNDLVGLRLEDLPSEGHASFLTGPRTASGMTVQDVVSPQARFERWFSGEFQASLSGAKWYHNGGDIYASIDAKNCTSGYPNIRVSLVQTHAGVITGSWPVSWACAGGFLGYNWGSKVNATYHLYFSRTGPPGIDENVKRVEGWVNYNA